MKAPVKEVQSLLDEVRRLFHVATGAAERLHFEERVSIGMRAVLEYLDKHGATTVPSIAAARGVSRQHIQTLVNALLEVDLVITEANPAHKRSVLISLTAAGAERIQAMKKRERAYLAEVCEALDAAALESACITLAEVRKVLEAR